MSKNSFEVKMLETLNYTQLMQNALRNLVKDVLKQIEIYGLPGDHHFYITFDTTHPSVEIAEWLKEKHPNEITIVIENWFDGLKVTESDFSITLNFGDQLEEMTVPFKSILSFVDPSVEFGLKFEKLESVENDQSNEAQMITLEGDEQNEAEIVSLDSFRK